MDAYAALGVTHVGTLAECCHQHHHPVRDAFRDSLFRDAVNLATIRFKFPKPPPSGRAVTRARRAERKLEQALGENLVNVVTQNDDRVCQVCQDISDESPYTLDEARSLIPAHPRCRCAFFPVDADESPEES